MSDTLKKNLTMLCFVVALTSSGIYIIRLIFSIGIGQLNIACAVTECFMYNTIAFLGIITFFLYVWYLRSKRDILSWLIVIITVIIIYLFYFYPGGWPFGGI